MYDDKWTEVNNNQNDQNNQSGPQAAGNQTGMGQPARKRREEWRRPWGERQQP